MVACIKKIKNFNLVALQDWSAKNKILTMFLILGLVALQSTFADDFGLNDKVKVLLDFVTSPWVKGVACVFLIAECIGLLTAGRQEPGMFKKFIPWIAGTIIFMASGTIVNKFLDLNATNKDNITKVLESK